MRWLVACALVVVAGHAALAKRVILEPPLVRACPGGTTWPTVAACLAKQGTAVVVRQTTTARLVRVVQLRDGKPYNRTLLYYVIRKGAWKLGGHWRSYGADFDILGFAPLTVGKHVGHRIDVGQTMAFTAVVDDISPVPALLRTQHALLCGGDYYTCADVTTRCEVLVHGRAVSAFHGVLSIRDNNLAQVSGDRSRVGRNCVAADRRTYLGWLQP